MSKDTIPNSFAETLKDCIEGSEHTQKTIALSTGIPTQHLTNMKNGNRRCTAEYDLRLSRYFGIKPGFFLRLQTASDLRQAQAVCGKEIEKEVQPA